MEKWSAGSDSGAVASTGTSRRRPLPQVRNQRVAHLKVRIDRQLVDQLRDNADVNRLSLRDAVRELLRRQLAGAREEEIRDVQVAALAALLAAEHALLAIESILPRGNESRPQLAEEAAVKAHQRLERVRPAVEEERK